MRSLRTGTLSSDTDSRVKFIRQKSHSSENTEMPKPPDGPLFYSAATMKRSGQLTRSKGPVARTQMLEAPPFNKHHKSSSFLPSLSRANPFHSIIIFKKFI